MSANPWTTTPSVRTAAPSVGPRTSSSPWITTSLVAVGCGALVGCAVGVGVGCGVGVGAGAVATAVGVVCVGRGSAVTHAPHSSSSSAAMQAMARSHPFNEKSPGLSVRRVSRHAFVERQAQHERGLVVGIGCRRLLYGEGAAIARRQRMRDVKPQPRASLLLAPRHGGRPASIEYVPLVSRATPGPSSHTCTKNRASPRDSRTSTCESAKRMALSTRFVTMCSMAALSE